MLQSLEILGNPDGPWSEALRGFAATVMLGYRNGTGALAIVGAWEGEGRTSVVASLGIVLAQLSAQVIVVDGDLRRPTLSKVFQLEERPGLTDFLTGQSGLSLYSTAVDRLRCLPCGTSLPEDSGALLLREEFAGLVKELRATGALLLFDTPAMGLCSDAVTIAGHLDGAYMVVGLDQFSGPAEGHFVEDLRDQQVEVRGVILTGCRQMEQTAYRSRA
ncbi:MAG: CpsD/CapB family tyrosine-protein kinase [Candidatus Eremiobacteraeota bacterium]|nr:CpsD/CapB family tyrosine-protein kinase [Candidatus Eremiobacteraeota bacterium]